jgi:hypothetical protein
MATKEATITPSMLLPRMLSVKNVNCQLETFTNHSPPRPCLWLWRNFNNIFGAIGKGYYEKDEQELNKSRS